MDKFVGLLTSEASTVAKEIDHRHTNQAVHVENQGWTLEVIERNDQGHFLLYVKKIRTTIKEQVSPYLCRGELLDLEGVVHHGSLREILPSKIGQQADTSVGIVDRLDAMSDTHNQSAGGTRTRDELGRRQTAIKSLGELFGRSVESSTKAVTLKGVKGEIKSREPGKKNQYCTYNSE